MIDAMPRSGVDPWPKQWNNDVGNLVLWDYFPASWSCPHDVQRVGRLGDGGKWVCGMSVYESIPAPESWKSSVPSTGQDGLVVWAGGRQDVRDVLRRPARGFKGKGASTAP